MADSTVTYGQMELLVNTITDRLKAPQRVLELEERVDEALAALEPVFRALTYRRLPSEDAVLKAKAAMEFLRREG